MTINLPHHLAIATALQRVDRFLDDLQANQDLPATISDLRKDLDYDFSILKFSLTAKGNMTGKEFHIKGDFTVKQGEVLVDIELPAMARLFQGDIRMMIEEELTQRMSE